GCSTKLVLDHIAEHNSCTFLYEHACLDCPLTACRSRNERNTTHKSPGHRRLPDTPLTQFAFNRMTYSHDANHRSDYDYRSVDRTFAHLHHRRSGPALLDQLHRALLRVDLHSLDTGLHPLHR